MFKIISDSSLDLSEKLKGKLDIKRIPFKLHLDGKEYIDNEELDVNRFIEDMVSSIGVPKTSCPSPQEFLNEFNTEDDVFCITISSKLSGSYNAAVLAKDIREKDNNVHIFDSKSASVGQTLIGMKINELIELGYSFDKIVENIEVYIGSLKTFFLSDSLRNLIKNGRIPSWKGKIASALHIKPIMGSDDGNIELYDKARGSKKALLKLANLICENAKNSKEKVIAISHVNNLNRALELKELLEEKCKFKDVVIVPTHGLTSLYCDNKGIIVAF